MFDAVRLTLINGILLQTKLRRTRYWQKYLTLQHYCSSNGHASMKFLLRIYAFRPVLSLREWLIDYAASLLARYVSKIDFLHNNPSDPKAKNQHNAELVRVKSASTRSKFGFLFSSKTPNLMQIREILIIHSAASDIGNWKRLCYLHQMSMMNHMTLRRLYVCRSGIMMPFPPLTLLQSFTEKSLLWVLSSSFSDLTDESVRLREIPIAK